MIVADNTKREKQEKPGKQGKQGKQHPTPRKHERLKNMVTPVFWIALATTLVLIAVALAFPHSFEKASTATREFIAINFGWLYLVIITAMVFVCLYLILTPLGKIRLGDPGTKPEHSTFSWLAMLFSAGMGIGLVFYGAAEPLSHFAVSAPEAKLYSRQALRDALRYSFFHYGIHAWAVYTIVALALAYFQFRKKERTLLSATLKPLFGEKMEGIAGKIVDALTIVATVIGVATTLGFGAAQINGGFHYLFGVPVTRFIQLGIIIVATIIFLIDAASGIDKGVKVLSNTAIVFSLVLMVLALFLGPTVRIFNMFISTTGDYLNNFISMSFHSAPYAPSEQAWIRQWTILYWAWWISWSPFVGVFIARISKGRTVREFLTYVLVIPTVFSCIWFTIFGVMSTDSVAADHSLARMPIETALFGTFSHYKGGMLLSLIAIALVLLFFITSADSATYVLAMESENGTLQPHTRVMTVWGVIVASIAAVLLFAGGLDALQNALIIVALPFALILSLVTFSVVKELRYEGAQMGLEIKPETYPAKGEPFRSYEDAPAQVQDDSAQGEGDAQQAQGNSAQVQSDAQQAQGNSMQA